MRYLAYDAAKPSPQNCCVTDSSPSRYYERGAKYLLIKRNRDTLASIQWLFKNFGQIGNTSHDFNDEGSFEDSYL